VKRSIRAVVFDFDGVIVDSEGAHFAALRDTMAAEGWPLSKLDYCDRYLGYSDRDTFEALNHDRSLQLTAAAITRLIADKARRYEELAHHGPLAFPGAVDCVRLLAQRFPLAIASGAVRREIAAALDELALSDCFAAIVGADDVETHKPDPAPYLEAARRLNIAPASCAAIEDSPWGLESARGAGMFTIGVTHSYPAARLPADVVLSSLGEVARALV
jgi:beta-phosphoglucomutase